MSHAGGRLSYRGNRRAGTTVKISEVAEQKQDGMMEWSWVDRENIVAPSAGLRAICKHSISYLHYYHSIQPGDGAQSQFARNTTASDDVTAAW